MQVRGHTHVSMATCHRARATSFLSTPLRVSFSLCLYRCFFCVLFVLFYSQLPPYVFFVFFHRFFVCALLVLSSCFRFFFFFNDTATTEIYTLSLHDALPI